ncbi:MAG TPA: PASTA domain-containing protein [Gaiellaceae bacterium]|nr:PASTA domain-containing protein [Gaiellaceae bacterium]
MPETTPPDTWPTTEDETVVQQHETLVGGAPPPPVVPAPGPPPPGPPADRRIGAGMLLGLGVLALVAVGILIAWLLTNRNDKPKPTTVVVTTAPSTTVAPKVAVPRFVGLTEQDALVRAGQVGLQPKEVFKASKAPKGTVISQRPPEGTELARGGSVTLVVDSNPKPATASTPTTTAGTTTPSSASTPTTTQSATTTPTTTAAAPAQPASATVPDVTGQKEAAAVTALGNAGILASIVFVPGTDPLGTVLQQAKPAGATVPFHAHVQINVSRGPNATTDATVPNVVGQTLQQAVSTLNAAHLRLIYLKYQVSSQAQAGKVVQQSPLAGAKAPQNAQVVVYLGAYKKG